MGSKIGNGYPIGCRTGKTSVIDPNAYYGQNLINNVSVPLEDLTIWVQLKTQKKGRTVLTSTGQDNTTSSSQSVRVTFIEGAEINGEKVLTSKFTDLTTVLDSNDNSSENLGITSIDIDFNSSYAPLITINFIDLRGSSIFQNEENIGNGNKYSSFFQLPYPLYELTLKGYYGQPVTYCLHMTKFNSKFNSQTGNFEITANFVGYTYAMLSDMLIGYLKAIPKTVKGHNKYEEINSERKALHLPGIITLNELMINISNINNDIKKMSSEEDSAKEISISANRITLIDEIFNEIHQLSNTNRDLFNIDNEVVNFIMIPHLEEGNPDFNTTEYNNSINILIQKYNDLGNELSLDPNMFLKIPRYNYLSLKILNDDTSDGLKYLSGEFKTKNISDVVPKKEEILNELKKRNFDGLNGFVLYDFIEINKILDINKTMLENKINNSKIELATKIRTRITGKIGFEPTIRNIVEIFTTAVEVFMGVLYDVSVAAEKNTDRTDELTKKFKDEEQSDSLGFKTKHFFPWPDYRQNRDKEGYVETYLGDATLNLNKEKIDELKFINELFDGFIKAKKEDDIAQTILTNNSINWVPVNPFDTRLFIDSQPYLRVKLESDLDVYRLILTRAITFLGYTNSEDILSDKDIESMATYEANNVLSNLINPIVKQSLNNTTIDKIINVIGKSGTNLSGRKIITLNGTNYEYDYLINGIVRVIPLSTNGEEIPLNSTGYELAKISDQNIINGFNNVVNPKNYFLTNYGSQNITNKNLDGGIYVKILTIEEYNNTLTKQPFGIDIITTSELVLSELNKENDKITPAAGFTAFGGDYGIQEFKNLNYGVPDLNGLELRYVFYNETTPFNGLGFTRLESSPQKRGQTSKNDLDIKPNNGFEILSNPDNLITEAGVNTLHNNYGKNLYLFNILKTSTSTITYPYIFQPISGDKLDITNYISLFGTRWYYGQSESKFSEYAKALLFLNSIPFINSGKEDIFGLEWFQGKTFESNKILRLFDKKGGFIHSPTLWCAYIGGLIWRADTSEPEYQKSPDGTFNQITNYGGSGNVDPIVWFDGITPIAPTFTVNSRPPSRTEYFDRLVGDNNTYTSYHKLLLNLPDQVKLEFKKAFIDFVNPIHGITWSNIKNECEIWNGTGSEFSSELDYIYKNIVYSDNKLYFNGLKYNNPNFKNIDKYVVITPVVDNVNRWKKYLDDLSSNPSLPLPKLENYDYSLFLEFIGGYNDNIAVSRIIDALNDEVIITNSGYGIWVEDNFSNNRYPNSVRNKITVTKNKLEDYLNVLIPKLKPSLLKITEEKKQAEQAIFGTTNENIIKHNLYRTCKNIYDKWLGGVTNSNNIIFQCGQDDNFNIKIKNGLDKDLAARVRGDGATPKLIDSFRFVNRSFRDIGNELFINPTPLNDYLRNSPNSSFYDVVTNLLSSNNFDFIPLPSYINYNDDKTLEKMFETVTVTNDVIQNGICGPSFVCVYLGQSSKHLDFKNSEYNNDGFDFQCNDTGGLSTKIPQDFKNDSLDGENKVVVFSVNYSQQNQNIFKDITLDQSEFSETAESLQIIDDISKTGSENNRVFGGQNMYNVYSVRSYKAEVEMMGNAMIQPMMYFQLNNIPMFHGAYMITHVKHSIKPNHMSTVFSGSRVRYPETKLFDGVDLYMDILSSIDLSSNLVTKTKNIGKGLMNENYKKFSGFVNYEVKPIFSEPPYTNYVLNYQSNKNNKIDGGGDNYMMKEAGQFIESLAIKWNINNRQLTNSSTIWVNNLTANGGGSYSHNDDYSGSKHTYGIAADLRPMESIKGTKEQGCLVDIYPYDKNKNREFIETAFELIETNPWNKLYTSDIPDANGKKTLTIDNIILNDDDIIKYFQGEESVTLKNRDVWGKGPKKINTKGEFIVISAPKHSNHIHIDFAVPPRVLEAVAQAKTTDELIITTSKNSPFQN